MEMVYNPAFFSAYFIHFCQHACFLVIKQELAMARSALQIAYIESTFPLQPRPLSETFQSFRACVY